eukprot:594477_1
MRMIIIVTFCALWTLLQAGCSPSATEDRAVIADKVYACPGTIASGGMFGDDAEALCGTGYHVCTSAIEVESLGYTDEDCQAIVGQLEFFGTQETSDGRMRFFSHRGGQIAPNIMIFGAVLKMGANRVFVFKS